ncbi:hypothetical protein FK216_00415 [Moraxellaceae bacterium AER2_44_116]|nr:hypothetical protein [Moraxellaceae bacterium]TQC99746.1 hypothetical protein FK216_00415 [Moraxellaceae bacterium AER2_44_116]
MAKDLLVTDSLSEQMINAGVMLIERLDQSNAQVKSAFWLYFSELRTWKLVIASDLIAANGPRMFYEKIVTANSLASESENIISLNDIGVEALDNKVVQLLAMMISTGSGISSIRFSKNNINGVYIEDAYIYRSSR